MTIDTSALRALIHEAVEEYRKQLEQIKDLLETEFGGTVCGSLQDEMCGIAPIIGVEGCKDYPKVVIIETDYTGRWNAYIADEDVTDIDISPKLERALERARANAIALSAMGDMILEVVQS